MQALSVTRASTHRHLVQTADRPALGALINCPAEYPLQMYKFLITILSSSFKTIIIMVALWNKADHYIFMLWFVLSFFFFFLA